VRPATAGYPVKLNQEILDYVVAVVVRGPWLTDPS
jgi:hypothetical protein